MPNIHWRKVVKLAAKDFACFHMASDDKTQTITLEAMLGCRNPDDEPFDRIYYGWHAVYVMPENTLQQLELFSGTCHKLGQWRHNDLTAQELKQINLHMEEQLSDWHKKLELAGVLCELEVIAPAANE